MIAAAKRHWTILWAARWIARWEGFTSPAVLDTLADPPVWTVFYGHTKYAGKPIPYAGMRGTKAEGLRVLARDCHGSAKAVEQAIHKPLTVRQRIALMSFAFNLGPAYLADLAPMINHGNIKGAADKMLEYDHAGGIVVEGLRRRREAERRLMLHRRR